MKLIIAGKRTISPVFGFIDNSIKLLGVTKGIVEGITEVVSGGARGIDTEGEHWADRRGCQIKRFLPDWDKHGKAAGPIRNRQMAEYGDALLLIWDGESRGSASMKKEMEKLGKPVYEVILKGRLK